jgi:hypothetical protein
MGINISKIYVALEDQQPKHQSHMIEVEGEMINHHVSILIDSGEFHSYIDPKIVERFHLEKINIEKTFLV